MKSLIVSEKIHLIMVLMALPPMDLISFENAN